MLTGGLSLERQAQKKLVDVYQRRRDLVKTIPKFWPVALMNNVTFAMQAQHPDDQKALQHLTDVWVERHPVEPRAFTVEFVSTSSPLSHAFTYQIRAFIEFS